MTDWLVHACDLARRGDAFVRVTIAGTRGSTPREPGATMLVTQTALYGTIGGGALEWAMIDAARERLSHDRTGATVIRQPLGPGLGQCCGGQVTLVLALEPATDPGEAAARWQAVHDRAEQHGEVTMETLGGDVSPDRLSGDRDAATAGRDAAVIQREEAANGGQWRIVQTFRSSVLPVIVYGAGHVGRHLVPILANAPFRVTWIDGRPGYLPDPCPTGVLRAPMDRPERYPPLAPDGAAHVVMTHSHPLDEAICRAALLDGRFAYLGLIGSGTKRARFAGSLLASGVPEDRLARLTCPIGVPGIREKHPGAIAIAVAAELATLLQPRHRDTDAFTTDAGRV